MQVRGVFLGLAMLSILVAGCDNNNLFSELADDSSTQAKLEEAQNALDQGDCETAIAVFLELGAANSNDVALRIDLAAAYMCRAGFDVTAFISIAASSASGTVTEGELFETIADQAVTSISASWPEDIDAAEALLEGDPTTSPPEIAFRNDLDAGFNLAIVKLVEAVLLIVDILNYVDGVVDCALDQGSVDFGSCEITADNVIDLVNALQESSDTLANLNLPSDASDSIDTVLEDLNAVDGDSTNPIVCSDVEMYLEDQQFEGIDQVNCV